mmetsp:Transcript_4670/g.8597  ORF Transcript_4670/g.8597 Transcript_4670/m.8597 type:complete len:213 (-) Transcript_4670:248-886(-)
MLPSSSSPSPWSAVPSSGTICIHGKGPVLISITFSVSSNVPSSNFALSVDTIGPDCCSTEIFRSATGRSGLDSVAVLWFFSRITSITELEFSSTIPLKVDSGIACSDDRDSLDRFFKRAAALSTSIAASSSKILAISLSLSEASSDSSTIVSSITFVLLERFLKGKSLLLILGGLIGAVSLAFLVCGALSSCVEAVTTPHSSVLAPKTNGFG